MTTRTVLATRDLAVGYRHGRRRRVVLDGLGLGLRAGELTCLLGPNGSGKTTLLRTLAGMQTPLAGEARLLGDDAARLPALERARRLAVVLTDRVDAGIMRAADLVALGRYPHTGWSGRLRESDVEAVRWALDATGADPLADRNVAELSDGERQRVLLARALAQQPQVLALDEAVAFIDVARRVELTGLLRHLARECDLAVLLTTHDLDLALRVADTVWLIDDRAVRVGAPEDLVLRGTVEHAFASAGVTFDPLRGAFTPATRPLARASVVGRGAAAAWTARALEREGYALAAAGEPADVEVVVDDADGDARWRLSSPRGMTEHASVADLAVTARGLLPRRAASPARR